MTPNTSRAAGELDRCLARYRLWERRFLARPADPPTHSAFVRAVADLCRATGERCGREAAQAAEAAARPRPPVLDSRGDTS
ncbi:DUF5133 domain-containing protein [Streptomyces sp. VRA16 Mangrove soil]|uniref:DUF5133 domain-containing protein n=1 Tax=Streptomyces sp. VRA16 Mangrove soil TaxID=2817434 RepID=UPI001A9E2989|nr:DUF5133 domain-containing protein [Streptomyces sp. VRA16 Mangrove soil]MBO1332720.1 DUF5133 domain-containing protein [Streptomyces sp. VRA16 Mangrove soil]